MSRSAEREPSVLTALFLFLFLVRLPSSVAAEELRLDRVEHLTVDDGLAHSTVWDIEQDRLGFLWIATVNGLQRYDGYELETYKHDPDDPDSLSATRVRAIYEDREGTLWLPTLGGGLNRFDRAAERFVRFRQDPDDPTSLADDNLRTVHEDSSGTLWLGGAGGLHRLDRRTGTFVRYRYDPDDPGSPSPGTVHAILEDRRGVLWMGTERGLDRFEPDGGPEGGGRFVHHRHDPGDAGTLVHDIVRALHEDQRGVLWVGTEGGLDRLEPESETFVHCRFDATEPPGRSADLIRAIHEDRGGVLWFGTESGGLLRHVPGSGRFVRYLHDPDTPSGLSSDSVFDIHEDDTGILWIATRGGLNKVDPRRERFAVLRRGAEDDGGLGGSRVWGFTADRAGILWIGTRDGGLTALDRARRTAVHYRPEPGEENSLIHQDVADVVEDPSGNLWIGTAGGLSRLGPDRRRFVHYRHEPGNLQSLWSDKIYSLLADSTGRIWIATRSTGIQRIDRPAGARESFVTYLHDPNDDRSLGANEAYGFYEDHAGEIWIGTVAGLNRFDRETEHFERFPHDPDNPDSVSSDDVTAILEDGAGIFWIGTLGGGLNRWDRASGEFRHYREKDGLPSDNVESILEDGRGYLWLAAGQGLSRFDPRTESFRNYDMDDGLNGNSFEIGSSFRSPGGELYFGGPGGITAFFPDRIEDDPRPPKVVLTGFRLAGEPVPLKRLDPASPLDVSIAEAPRLVLTHRQKVFSIEFAALHYASPERNHYAYRLEGFDDGWVETDAGKRFAHYTNLDPRSYLFRVKASNKDGYWNEEGATIRVHVLAPPWRTWWAYSLYGLALAAVILGYVRSHRRELRRERQAAERERAISARLREVDKLKDEFLANTSHELRTPLYGITGLAESLIDGARGELPAEARSDLSLLVASGRRLTSLVDDILDFSKLRHQSLELARRPVDIRALTEVVLTLSRPLVGSKDLELANAVPADLPPADADESRLEQILHNLVGNAVKFTESGLVEVSAAVAGDELSVSVRDTGIGISEERQGQIFDAFEQADASAEREYGGTGLGLAVTRQLVELHGGTLGVRSTPGKGSTFHFTLPISTEKVTRRESAIARVPVPEPPSDGDAAVPAAAGSVPREGAASILVVEDEPVIRRVLVNQLAAQGYRITQAASGAEALRRIESRPPDLVLLDVMMPRMSGFEVCRALRERHSLHELPVIFLTAKNRVEDLVVGLAAGANDYLPKPISKSELASRVNTHLELLSIHRELGRLVAERTSELRERERLLTERDRLIGELETKNAELARFNYTISHDLKSPLVTIKNFLGLLRRDASAESSAELAHHLEYLDSAADQMHRLLEELFEFSRVGFQTIVPERVAFSDLVREVLEDLSQPIAESRAALEVAAGLPAVTGDRGQLRQLVRHLVDNALRHSDSREGPRIAIGADDSGPETVFFVADDGPGIEPRFHDKVFELFERLETRAEGTGVGLALVKRIVEAHGGSIWIESQGLGNGSTFRFTLPRGKLGSVELDRRRE